MYHARLFIIRLIMVFWPGAVFAAQNSVSASDIQSFYEMLKGLNWDVSSDSRRAEIFERVESAVGDLDENMDDLKQNYQDVRDNEQSTANKALTSVTTLATGLGAMQAMQGWAEQKADRNADADMSAYLETFRCTYGDGKSVKWGPNEIELPGGNDETIAKYRNEYMTLVASLKERKESLNMKPGIESEVVFDKAEMGLYDDENVGITGGAYSSLYRAKALGSEEDQTKISEEQSKSINRLKYGAIAAGAGVAVGIIGNFLINAKSVKNKSSQLRDEREKIVSDIYDVMQNVVDDCNNNIRKAQNNIIPESKYIPESVDGEPVLSYAEYVSEIKSMTTIKDLNEIERIKDIPVCK